MARTRRNNGSFTGENIGAIAETSDLLAPGGTFTIMTGSEAPLAEITTALTEAGAGTITVEEAAPLIIMATF